jgi:AmmeMemoRadiSam system protein B
MSSRSVRPPSCAGAFYPADSRELAATLERLLADAEQQQLPREVFGLIVPHAGYMYSGTVAAAAYKLVRGADFERVVVFGPAHRYHFRGASVGRFDAYETPLGEVPVDTKTVEDLIDLRECARFHPEAHDGEHSLEVQLPFLQVAIGAVPIVPILIGDCAFQTCGRLVASLHQALKGLRVLYLASTDLSHYHSYEEATRRDSHTLDVVQSGDAERFHGLTEIGECELCGASAVSALLLLSGVRKGAKPILLSRTNSGDVTGDRSRVVGYASLALTA